MSPTLLREEIMEIQPVFDVKYQPLVTKKLDEEQVKVSQLVIFPIKVGTGTRLIISWLCKLLTW